MAGSRITMLMALGACAAGCIDTSLGEVPSVDVPASALSIEPAIVDDDPAPADGMVPISVQFFHANAFVRLASGSVSCNGVALPWGQLGYTTRIPIVAAGGNIVFQYTRAGVTTQFAYKVPARPMITSPAADETVPRDSSLMIAYVASKGSGVRPVASDGAFSISGVEQADTGTALLDASRLRSGRGTLGLTRRLVSSPPDSGFQATVVTYTITSAPTSVIWQ